ncbi:1-acyl-sn-glycerol-3-phosphate acyltransferase [Lacimicrobium alkaliphilum]|uniref:1-acyl-sn-glycerol-3-phosphate acyltransferase n=1 Tax=Lacimicrobium alkaliphilum TaxID=1526571 RepID=UPI000A891C94|nr:1-acyl-sn-glycerol-3-phosphate acyltransferase [Lacimicrobium alkaliphilum]
MTEQTNNNSAGFGQRTANYLLHLAGWQVSPFPDLKQAIVVGGPHTSNWDGVLGILSAATLGVHSRIMIKNNLFKWPLAPLLRKLGGIPIDRSRSTGVVEQAAALFGQYHKLVLIMTPEGTRTRAPRWKTGFYHIANKACVPIVLATADYVKKQVTFPLVLQPSGNLEADMHRMYQCFASVIPRHPDKLSAPVKVLWDKQHGIGHD